MRELDEKKVYSLEELTSEERKELWIYLTKVDESWTGDINKILFFKCDYLYFCFNWAERGEWLVSSDLDFIKGKQVTNAKELFYTLENVQVDCSNETKERINDMFELVRNKGFQTRIDALTTEKHFVFFRQEITGDKFGLFEKASEKTTITYEKFMELFGSKEEVKLDIVKYMDLSANLERLELNKVYIADIETSDFRYGTCGEPVSEGLKSLLNEVKSEDKKCYYFYHSEKHGPNFYTKEDVPYHDGEDWKEELVVYTQLGSGKKFVTTKERFKKFKEVWV